MKATGIVRRIDDLGRVVIPKEIRRTMRIREGDPLEIYTEKDGEVIFKKYSPMGELSEFAESMSEAIYKTCGCAAAVSDRDEYIAVHGVPKRELTGRHISKELENIMEQRRIFKTENGREIPLTEGGEYNAGIAAPIIAQGDVMGCLVLIYDKDRPSGEVEYKLAQTIGDFLGRQMEN